jgi:hypothetical protein
VCDHDVGRVVSQCKLDGTQTPESRRLDGYGRSRNMPNPRTNLFVTPRPLRIQGLGQSILDVEDVDVMAAARKGER